MARIAGAAGGNVCRGFGPCSGGRVTATVAGRALADSAGVIHRGRPERNEVLVAGVALRSGGYMVCRFGQSSAAGCVAG